MHNISVESTNVMSPDNASEQEKSLPKANSQTEDEDLITHVRKSFGTIIK